ncbi:MAG: hypothetical protein JNK49_02755 [Planctomycetes bacterium]|nr:hypothetical protein [Planctomycetota bacterium]
MTRRLATLLLPLLAVGAVAQTFVVDEANGPGANFTDLPAAVLAVPNGAVLLVRPGNYQSPSLGAKTLTLLGEPGANLQPTGLAGGLTISFLGPNQTILVRGFTFSGPIGLGNFTVDCQQCQGAVVLEQLSGPSGILSRLDATSCDRLLVRNCVFRRSSRLRDCNTVLQDCTIAPLGPEGIEALRVTRGTTQVIGGTLQGAAGNLNRGGPAVLSDNAALRVLGTGTLAGGQGVPAGFAVAGTGTVRVDPAVAVSGANPPFAVGVQATVAPQAWVVASDPVLGNPVNVELRGPLGDLGALGVGFPGASHAVPGVTDRLFWNGSTAVTQAIGVVQAGAPVAAVVTLPNQQSLLGLQLVWHGVTFAAANGLQVSPPAWYVARL